MEETEYAATSELQTHVLDGGPTLLLLALIPLLSIVMMVLALRLALRRSQGKELVLWVIGFLLLPILCPAAALIYFRGKPELN